MVAQYVEAWQSLQYDTPASHMPNPCGVCLCLRGWLLHRLCGLLMMGLPSRGSQSRPQGMRPPPGSITQPHSLMVGLSCGVCSLLVCLQLVHTSLHSTACRLCASSVCMSTGCLVVNTHLLGCNTEYPVPPGKSELVLHAFSTSAALVHQHWWTTVYVTAIMPSLLPSANQRAMTPWRYIQQPQCSSANMPSLLASVPVNDAVAPW